MRSETPSVPCPKCSGEGFIPLSTRLEETLVLVWRFPGRPLQGYKIRGIGQAAINRRLHELLELDLVRREREGHSWKWFPAR